MTLPSALGFDADTGQLLETELEKQVNENVRLAIADAEALKQMKATKGWGIYSKFVSELVDSSVRKLLEEKEHDEVRRLQEYIKCGTNVLAFVDSKILEAENLTVEFLHASEEPQDPATEAGQSEE